MTDGGPRKIGVSIELKPHAYDPIANPELFEGVLARRCIAFLVDVVIITVPVVLAAIFIFIFGLFTLGVGWALFWLLSPGAVIWAVVYYGLTFGSEASATIGMRITDIEMRTWYGAPAYFVLGAVHAVVYWVTADLAPQASACRRTPGSRAPRPPSNPLFRQPLHGAACGRMAWTRAGLLMTTVPTSMSCSSRLRLLNRQTSRMNGVRNDTVSQ